MPLTPVQLDQKWTWVVTPSTHFEIRAAGIPGPTGATGPAGPNQLLTNLTVWADPINGTAGGVRGDMAKPFQTIAQAEAAASAGDLVRVRPGSYTLAADLTKPLTWELDPGAVFTSAADIPILDAFTAGTYTFRGGRVVAQGYAFRSEGTTVLVEGVDIAFAGTASAPGAFPVTSTGNMTVRDCKIALSGGYTGIDSDGVFVMDRCTFTASGTGAFGQVFSPANVTVRNTDFTGGATNLGLVLNGGTARLVNCKIDTSANASTPPIFNITGSTVTLENCTLVANAAQNSIDAILPLTVTVVGTLTINRPLGANVTVVGGEVIRSDLGQVTTQGSLVVRQAGGTSGTDQLEVSHNGSQVTYRNRDTGGHRWRNAADIANSMLLTDLGDLTVGNSVTAGNGGVVSAGDITTNIGTVRGAVLLARPSGGVAGTDELEIVHMGTGAARLRNKETQGGGGIEFRNAADTFQNFLVNDTGDGFFRGFLVVNSGIAVNTGGLQVSAGGMNVSGTVGFDGGDVSMSGTLTVGTNLNVTNELFVNGEARFDGGVRTPIIQNVDGDSVIEFGGGNVVTTATNAVIHATNGLKVRQQGGVQDVDQVNIRHDGTDAFFVNKTALGGYLFRNAADDKTLFSIDNANTDGSPNPTANFFYTGAAGGADFSSWLGSVQQLSFGFNNQAIFSGVAGADSGRTLYFYDRVSAAYRGALDQNGAWYFGSGPTTFSALARQPNTGTVPFSVRGANGQTADHQQWQLHDGTVIARVKLENGWGHIDTANLRAIPLGGATTASVQAWKDTTPTRAISFGMNVPGLSLTNNLVLSYYTGTVWGELWRSEDLSNASGTHLHIPISAAGRKGLVIQQAGSPSADPFQVQNNSSQNVLRVWSGTDGILSLAASGTDTIVFYGGSVSPQARVIMQSDGQLTWSSNSDLATAANRDVSFGRAAARVLQIKNGNSNNAGGTLASIPLSPAQITSDQNNYDPGPGAFRFARINSDAARSITGMVAGVNGEERTLTNVGSFNITLVNASGSSTAANQFLTASGANVVLAPNASAYMWYDDTTDRWRVY